MEIPLYQVDAFTSVPFKGNPAAVCLLDGPRSDEWMQSVAEEMNLSETAFIYRREDGFSLRWFTPAVEVPLCGHATLASAHVLWEAGRLAAEEKAHFHTASGLLTARRADERIELDFPAIHSEATSLSEPVRAALGIEPGLVTAVCETMTAKEHGLLIELENDQAVRNVKPDFAGLARAFSSSVIITSRSSSPEFDFVSRFFAVYAGIDEDPVTGSAHCALAPYWSRRLGKSEMTGYQASRRGGVVGVRIEGDRVKLLGAAVTVLRGALVDGN